MSAVDLGKYAAKLSGGPLLSWRGVVLRVAGLAVESKGPPVGVGEVCEICLDGGRRVPAEVVAFTGDRRVLLPLEAIDGIAPGNPVLCREGGRQIPVGEEILGRVIDGLGRPIDGQGPLVGQDRLAPGNTPPEPLNRPMITEPLAFGLRAFDGLVTCGRGQRLGIFAGTGLGKSTLLGEVARVSNADVNVLALVGERGREVRHFLADALGPEGLARSVVVVATSDASAIQRVRSAFLAITIAEYFRDQGKDVMFLMDSLTRFAMAQREIGLAAGEPPTTKGYCPSVFSLLPKLTERLGRTETGSITGVLTILVEADDLADPVADSALSLLDGHVVLSRKLAAIGQYPAVDILQSISRLMTSIVDKQHLLAAQRMRAIYSTYQSAEDLINIGAYVPGSNPRIDAAVKWIDPVRQFLTQPLGTRTGLAETVRRMCEITREWDFIGPDGDETGEAGGPRA